MAPEEPMFTTEELRGLLKREEGQFLEFKSLWDRSEGSKRPLERKKVRDLLAEYVAAFANADGGTLLLGVEDDGTPSGHEYPKDVLDGFLEATERRLRPAIKCRTQEIIIDDHPILVFQVPIAPKAVMVEGNGFPYRLGDQVVREEQEIINDRKTAYRRVGYENRVHPEATLDDLDLDLAKRFLSGTVFRERRAEEMLLHYSLLLPRAGSMAVTNAALLLFGKAPITRWHPRAGLRFFRVAGKDRLHGEDRNVTQLGRIELPLAAAIKEAHRLAREQIRRSERLHDLFFREMPEYPESAWQEAIVNAFAHRDYEDRSREIEVWFYEDRMEVLSPGELVPPVTVDGLLRRKPLHASRNPLLVRVLAESGLMREEGEGVPRMFDEMERSFLHAPGFRMENGTLSVSLRNEPIFEGPGREWQKIVQALPLQSGQKRILLGHPGGFTNEDYRRINNVDRDQAYREIQDMVSLGAVLPAEAPGRGAIYHVSPRLEESRVFLQERVPRLRRHFDRKPALANADYRSLFIVTRARAARELGRLVEEGFLKLEGKGRGARYLPGPEMADGRRTSAK